MPKIIRQEPDMPDPAYLSRLVDEYIKQKAFSDSAAARTEEMKKELSALVDAEGYTDHVGHKWIEVESGVQLKRERRVSVALNHERTKEWAEKNNLWEEISVPIRVLNEDSLANLAFDNPPMQGEIQDLYDERETWAFKIVQPKN